MWITLSNGASVGCGKPAFFGVHLFCTHYVVEARGIEPLSENLLMQLSPGAEYLLYFPQVPPVLRLCLSVAF